MNEPALFELAPVLTANNYRAGTGECEWYTPAEYIEMARRVLGTIDLDPASSDLAQETVRARRYFTKRDNGLVQPWHGRVWCNPPYSQPTIERFVCKLLQEYDLGRVTEAILLTNNQTDVGWFHAAANACAAKCFPRGRIRFLTPSGQTGSPTQGQCVFYFGARVEAFVEEFQTVGFILTPPPALERGGLL
jgi:phage N-6-adenine-methyltransferase